MYCEKCGAKNEEGSRFCAICGAAMASNRSRKSSAKSNRPLICLIAVVLCIVLCVVVGAGLLGGRSANDTAAGVIHALKLLDLVQLHELLPEPVQYSLEGDFPEIYEQQLTERSEDVQSELASYGTTVKWSQGSLTDVSEDTLNDLKDYYQDAYGMKITDAKNLTITYEITAFGFFSQSESGEVYLIKYKGGWYLDWETAQNII